MKTFSLPISLLGAICAMLLFTSCGDSARTLTFDTNTVNYDKTVTRATAAKLGQYLKNNGHFDKARYVGLYVEKDRLDYTLHWVVTVGFLPTPDTLAYFRGLVDSLRLRVFDEREVTIYLTDHPEEEEWEILKEAEPMVRFGMHTLYYMPSVDRADAEKLANYLTAHEQFNFTTPQVLRLQAWGSEYVISMGLTDGVTDELITQISSLRGGISKEVFPDKELGMEFRDHLLHDILRDVSGPFFQNSLKVDGMEIRYSEGINELTAITLRNYLKTRGFLKHANWVNLSESDGGYKLTIPPRSGVKAPGDVRMARRLTMELKKVLGGRTDVELYDQGTRERELVPGGRQYELD